MLIWCQLKTDGTLKLGQFEEILIKVLFKKQWVACGETTSEGVEELLSPPELLGQEQRTVAVTWELGGLPWWFRW